MIDATRIAQAIHEELETQGPEVPYVGTKDDLCWVTLDGEFDLVAVGHAVLKLIAEDAALALTVKKL